MKSAAEHAGAVIAACNAVGIPHMLVGSFSRNVYAAPRSTQDADVVIAMEPDKVKALMVALSDEFVWEEQMTFETVTGTRRDTVTSKEGAFKVEVFWLSNDPHDRERFARRREIDFGGRKTWVPTAEDVIVMKLRWKRPKDIDDVRDVIEFQGNDALDWPYIHAWSEKHGTRALLDEIRASIPPLD